MAQPKVFLVLLRRPRPNDPDERRDDPFYEFGSFGCTGCHWHNLLHPRHAVELAGARLGFVQGGRLGFRLVFLTPAVTVLRWPDGRETRWAPAEMPFKYSESPILAYNHGPSDFPLVERFARRTTRTTVEGGLSSLFRSRARRLQPALANEVIRVYERQRQKARSSDFATRYDEALPYAPPVIDCNRKATYRRHIAELAREADGAGNVLHAEVLQPTTQSRSRCGVSRRRQLNRGPRLCT